MRGLSGSAWAAAATIAAPALRLSLGRRARRGKEIAARLPERRGIDPTPRPPGRLLWLHAASVGETVSVLPVLSALPPDLTVLLTTGTVTSAGLLARRLPELGLEQRVLHRFAPLDVPAWAARFLDHWRPDAGAFVESELWPNLIFAASARGIPLALLNARLSARSAAGWRRAPGLARRLLGAFAHVQAQSPEDAARLRGLGARHATCPGNLKFAAPKLAADTTELERLRAMIGTRPVWLAASTHPGEEEMVAATHRALAPAHPGLLTIIAPRHPERGRALAEALGGVPRRAARQDPREGIWLADTLGEFGLLYRLAPVVFIGGSLVPHGGQNPLEAARLGCAVASGPHMGNQAAAVAALREANALTELPDAAALTNWVDAMLRDPDRRAAAGAAAQCAAARDGDLPQRVAALLVSMANGANA